MKISVITPTYNSALTLKDTIDSVLAQSGFDVEHIIVDGGSTDETIDIVKKYDHLVWITEPDKGVYDAMNKGIKMATGDWVYFLGSDDTLYSTATFEYLFYNYSKFFQDNDIVFGDVIYKEEFRASHKHRFFDKFNFANININHQAMFYRKSVFDTYGDFNLDYFVYGDWEMNIRLFFKENIKTQYLPVIIANYSMLGLSNQKLDSFTNEKRKSMVEGLVRELGKKEQIKYLLFSNSKKTVWNKLKWVYRSLLLRFYS